MKRLPPCAVAVLVAAAIAACSSPARAEYVENAAGRSIATWNLAVSGTLAAGFDVGSGMYLAKGPGLQTGRVVTGVGSLTTGTVLVLGSLFTLGITGKDHIPPGSPDGPEARDLRTCRILSGVGIGVGVTSIVLGIASLMNYRKSDSQPAAQQTVQPLIVASPATGAPGLSFAFGF